MEIAIISEALFKQNSPIKEDTIITKFIPYIIIAQKLYVEKIIGRALMQELQTEIKAATTTPDVLPYPISPENQALIIELAPALSFYAVYQGLPFHWAAIVNKGITIRESENSAGIDVDDVAQLRRWLKDDAETLARQAVDYLCKCRANYPLWAPAEGYGCPEGCRQSPMPLDAGIYIPNRRRKCC